MKSSAWLAGLTVGAAAGFLSLELPLAGWLIGLAFFVGALRSPRRVAGVAGELVGFGGIWLVLLGRVAIECGITSNGFDCQAPGIEGWLAVGTVLLALGLLLTVAAAHRSSSARLPPGSR